MNALMPVIPRSGSRKVNGYVKAVLALEVVSTAAQAEPPRVTHRGPVR